MLVAVASGKSSLALYTVEAPGHRVRLATRLTGPTTTARLLAVSLSAVSTPVACATWSARNGEQLRCYDAGDAHGVVVAAARNPVFVGVSADGSRVAWTEHTDPERQDVVVADLRRGVASNLHRWVPDSHCTGDCTVFSQPTQLAWSGDDALMIAVATQDDEGPGLLRLALTARTEQKGWLSGGRVVAPPPSDQQRGWRYYDAVASSTRTTAAAFLAIERPSENGPPLLVHARGVRLASPSATPVVLARASAGRDVVSISGGRRGVVYETGAGYAPPNSAYRYVGRYYLALPGELVGQPLGGLPSDAWLVTAAPL